MKHEFDTRKEWKSISEQISLLKERGMIFENEERAKVLLEAFGYYRLSGYWFPFRTFEKGPNGKIVKRHDKFLENSFFEDAILLYDFDKKLRDLLFSSLEVIETGIKMAIAYNLGKHDTHAHYRNNFFEPQFLKSGMNSDNEKTPSKFDKWLKKHEDSIERAEKREFVKHNIKYGKLPIWIAVELWDFGSMSFLYHNLRAVYKDEIADKFGLNGKTLSSWIRSLNFIRNSCAHHMRIWNNNIPERARSNNIGFLQKTDGNRVFYYINIIEYLIQKLGVKNNLNRDITLLIRDFPKVRNNSVDVKDMGINEEDNSILIVP